MYPQYIYSAICIFGAVFHRYIVNCSRGYSILVYVHSASVKHIWCNSIPYIYHFGG